MFAITVAALHLITQSPTVVLNSESGIYQRNQTITWKIQSSNPVKYRIKEGGYKVIEEGTTSDNVSYLAKREGWLLAEFDVTDESGKVKKLLSGAMVDPDAIKPALEAPKDFWRFWDTKVKEAIKIPLNPIETKLESGIDTIQYSHIQLDGINQSKIRGQLALPTAAKEKLPALLIVQWAGVYPLEKPWAIDRAKEGWLTLNILAHDLPIMEPRDFYNAQSAGPLKNYPSIGSDDREKSYFLRMYTSCVRAAEYLATRPEWNGKVMVVTGGSQGGMQSIVTAALSRRITGVCADVPAGCDQTGNEFNRAPGWPSWKWMSSAYDAAKTRETGRYFDVINFAPRVKVPTLVGVGGIDTVCPPPGVITAYNQIRAKKELVWMKLADHTRDHNQYYARNAVWMGALKTGKTP
jgi:cephalosporin-C deacetylase